MIRGVAHAVALAKSGTVVKLHDETTGAAHAMLVMSPRAADGAPVVARSGHSGAGQFAALQIAAASIGVTAAA